MIMDRAVKFDRPINKCRGGKILNTNNIPDVLTINDLQDVLKIGRSTAYTIVKSGELKTIRIGRLIRIRREDLIDYLSGKCDNDT